MSRNPFDEFRKMEMLIQKLLKAGGTGRISGGGVFIRERDGRTKIDVREDVSDSAVERLKQKYPNAEISTKKKKKGTSKPRDPVVEEVQESEAGEDAGGMDAEKLALKRFREKKKKEEHKDSSA